MKTCKVIRPQESYEGKQGLTYMAGVYAENTGSEGLCMHLVRIPPGGKANAHLHENHESVAYVIRGEVCMWYGENLEEHAVIKEGEFIYIPAGIPHLSYNATDQEELGILARSDPNEQESVRLLPELDVIR